MKIRTIALMLTVVAVASLAAGQPAERVEVRLKATMHRALVDGDLQAAIEQYADIVAGAGGNRTVAAQALLQMGHAYEKLGRPEASDAYEQVLRDYADQAEPVAAARARLAALEVEATPVVARAPHRSGVGWDQVRHSAGRCLTGRPLGDGRRVVRRRESRDPQSRDR